MTPEETKRLQTRLKIVSDGVMGRGTWGALFTKFGAKDAVSRELALGAKVHVEKYNINTPLRLAHFMAQLTHESDNFKAMEEYASGAEYEGRQDLGNTQPGDGKRYKGRGPIQLTGRNNYREYGREAGFDFETHPEMVAFPSVGLLVACMFWSKRGLNQLADQDDITNITMRINGGFNGLDDRKQKLVLAKALLL